MDVLSNCYFHRMAWNQICRPEKTRNFWSLFLGNVGIWMEILLFPVKKYIRIGRILGHITLPVSFMQFCTCCLTGETLPDWFWTQNGLGFFRPSGKSILQVPDTGMFQYWWILEHFWCTSIAWKCDLYVL